MPKPKGATSFLLSREAHALQGALAEALGITKTAVLELALRRLARSEGVTVPPPTPTVVVSAHMTEAEEPAEAPPARGPAGRKPAAKRGKKGKDKEK
jgi:hypothetical protein